jgi:hypothetical protein
MVCQVRRIHLQNPPLVHEGTDLRLECGPEAQGLSPGLRPPVAGPLTPCRAQRIPQSAY